MNGEGGGHHGIGKCATRVVRQKTIEVVTCNEAFMNALGLNKTTKGVMNTNSCDVQDVIQ